MDIEKTTKNKKAEILEKQKKYLFPNHLLYYTDPLPLERGDGMYVWDVEGNKYLDFFAGILTTSVGHNRPEVTQAAVVVTCRTKVCLPLVRWWPRVVGGTLRWMRRAT